MIIYGTAEGGKYIPIDKYLKTFPEGKHNLYVNITNQCNCACTFCLRSMKEMREDASLWLRGKEPSVGEVKSLLDTVAWGRIKEVVFVGFGEPTMRLADLVELITYVKRHHPEVKTRLNTNGLSDLAYGRDTSKDFAGHILDTVSISLNASNAERYLELTRSVYGIRSFTAMLDFAEHMKAYVPNVVLTIVDEVEGPEEIERCRKICADRGLTLRVRPYEAN
ncbi:TIGR04100 family radical SAM protein [Selenomonas sp. TAMA-11512]|uniref:TatD family nuclease-associated radical SAM protein n=1 Tax=Selenomonas sp. TAMA-11512 TaxID=3095337 RepID=UPI00308EEB0B|nr:TIGR04100 family radical SAM protein [Selenomonas sp. TAMA-11512]